MSYQYYNKNSKKFIEETINIDMNKHHKKFLEYLRGGASILDAGVVLAGTHSVLKNWVMMLMPLMPQVKW